MIKRIVAFQRVLLNSIGKISDNWDMFIIIIVCAFLNPFVFYGSGYGSIYLILGLFMTYVAINGKSKLFKLMPVSTKFLVGNVFLMPILISVGALILMGVTGFTFANLIAIGVFISTKGSNNVYTQSNLVVNPVLAQGEWKGLILVLLTFLIITFVCTAVSLLKRKKLRYIAIITTLSIGYGFLIILNKVMPILPNEVPNPFAMQFANMPQANLILMSLSILALIIIPTSIWTGYKIYTKGL